MLDDEEGALFLFSLVDRSSPALCWRLNPSVRTLGLRIFSELRSEISSRLELVRCDGFEREHTNSTSLGCSTERHTSASCEPHLTFVLNRWLYYRVFLD